MAMYSEEIARLTKKLHDIEASKAYLDELKAAEKEIMDAVVAQMVLGKTPKYVVISEYIALALRKRYEKVHGKPCDKSTFKFATACGYLDIIELDREDKIILVG